MYFIQRYTKVRALLFRARTDTQTVFVGKYAGAYGVINSPNNRSTTGVRVGWKIIPEQRVSVGAKEMFLPGNDHRRAQREPGPRVGAGSEGRVESEHLPRKSWSELES